MAGTTAAIRHSVGTGAVPGQAYEQGSVMAPVGRPPVLGVGHQRPQVGLEGGVVEPGKGLGVVEVSAQGIGGRVVLMQQAHLDLIGPPLVVCCAGGGGHRSHLTTERALQLRHVPGARWS